MRLFFLSQGMGRMQMNHQELDQFLRRLNPIEEIQIGTNQMVSDYDGYEMTFEADNGVPRMLDYPFFDKGPIFINKSNRYADMPVHMHSFIEINYQYAGSCRQVINGREITLHQGQVSLLDTDVPHSIPALGDNDLLINILMKKEVFSSQFLGRLSTKGIVPGFLSNAVSQNQRHDRYILFHSQDNDSLQHVVRNILCEYFDQRDYSLEMVGYYVPIMFTELMRVYQLDKNFELDRPSAKASILSILQYIQQHYRDCTLTGLAEYFSFNPNYLGNMLKERTGKTFVELIQTERMVHAAALLGNTDKRTEEIAEEVGYESLSFFYRRFKEHFNETPYRFRQREQNK
jgi:AraC-like DNA-binding protein/mannose-6-phosphate isomerase-like protein (cupin superfamily)